MGLYIVDISTNGTIVNDIKLESGIEYQVNDKDIISLYMRKI